MANVWRVGAVLVVLLVFFFAMGVQLENTDARVAEAKAISALECARGDCPTADEIK